MQMILLVGGGLVFFLLIIGAFVSMTSERSLVEERLGPYVKMRRQAKPGQSYSGWRLVK